MKIIYRIPTKDPYAYIEVEHESVGLEPEIYRKNYDELSAVFRDGDGITRQEMNEVVDSMLRGESVNGGVQLWEKMSAEQKEICQTIKRATKRINGKIKDKEN